jgi:hypothetical protein
MHARVAVCTEGPPQWCARAAMQTMQSVNRPCRTGVDVLGLVRNFAGLDSSGGRQSKAAEWFVRGRHLFTCMQPWLPGVCAGMPLCRAPLAFISSCWAKSPCAAADRTMHAVVQGDTWCGRSFPSALRLTCCGVGIALHRCWMAYPWPTYGLVVDWCTRVSPLHVSHRNASTACDGTPTGCVHTVGRSANDACQLVCQTPPRTASL